MREIKFRVWDTMENKFFEPVYEAYKGKLLDLSISLSGELLRRTPEFPCEHESRFPGKYIIQQYTGLNDKNGKEIYEGDIVVILEDRFITKRWAVYWSEPTLCYYIRTNSGSQTLSTWDPKFIAVIGNIYENPELIK